MAHGPSKLIFKLKKITSVPSQSMNIMLKEEIESQKEQSQKLIVLIIDQ